MASVLACVLAGFLAAPTAQGSLLDVIPQDAAAAAWWRLNPERAFVCAHLEKVRARAEEAKVGEALFDLVEQIGGVQARLGMQGGTAMLMAMFGSIDYSNLLAEGMIALNLDPSPAVRIVVKPADAARAFKELAECLSALAQLAGKSVNVAKEGEWRVVYTSPQAPDIELCLARLDALVVLASRRGLVGEVEAVRDGQRPNLRANPKWRAAAAQLPEPEDLAYFFDLERLSALGARALAAAPPPEEENAALALAVAKDLIDSLGMLRVGSYAAGVSWTDGRIFRSASVSAMAEGWRETPLGKMFLGIEPELVPFERVPAGATSVAFQAKCDPAPVVDTVRAVLRKHLGAERVDGFCGDCRQALGIEPGELVCMMMGTQLQYQVKSMKPALLGSVDQSVAMLRVGNAEAFARCLTVIEREVLVKELGEFLRVEKLEGFPSLRCARLGGLPMGAFAWGMQGDTFYFSTDADVLLQGLRGENAGEAPFPWRDDFRMLGLSPSGPVFAFSFVDLGRLILNLSQVLNMAGIGAAFVPAGDREAEKVRRLFAFIPRLAAVLRNMDFFGGMASMTTFDARSGRFLSVEAVEVKEAPAALIRL